MALVRPHGHGPTTVGVQVTSEMKNQNAWVATAALLGLPLLAAAEAIPSDPRAPAPALEYRSAFSDYLPWQDLKPADWRAVNDAVRDAKPGGGSPEGQGAAPAPAKPASAPGHPHHGGHK